jgi:hypothetical protein
LAGEGALGPPSQCICAQAQRTFVLILAAPQLSFAASGVEALRIRNKGSTERDLCLRFLFESMSPVAVVFPDHKTVVSAVAPCKLRNCCSEDCDDLASSATGMENG